MGETEPVFHKMHLLPSKTKESLATVVVIFGLGVSLHSVQQLR